jgi:hypothetical protein
VSGDDKANLRDLRRAVCIRVVAAEGSQRGPEEGTGDLPDVGQRSAQRLRRLDNSWLLVVARSLEEECVRTPESGHSMVSPAMAMMLLPFPPRHNATHSSQVHLMNALFTRVRGRSLLGSPLNNI